ncbi:hypothetical protein HDU79_006952 [Rhizoclosmatium sp. JEL0117]|nr:hypothetical protein HDU79_006952 [Rhizoclosmatium sp. JEL0117]
MSTFPSATTLKRRTIEKVTEVADRLQLEVEKGEAAVWTTAQSFWAFIRAGNMVDLAVGLVMGAAFSAMVNSFLQDLITPILGLGGEHNMANLFLVMRCPDDSKIGKCKTGSAHGYTTIEQATTDGAVTWNYGRFIEYVLNFFIIGIAMFFFVKLYSNSILKPKNDAHKMKECEECCKEVPLKARKCHWCLSIFPVAGGETIVIIEEEFEAKLDVAKRAEKEEGGNENFKIGTVDGEAYTKYFTGAEKDD